MDQCQLLFDSITMRKETPAPDLDDPFNFRQKIQQRIAGVISSKCDSNSIESLLSEVGGAAIHDLRCPSGQSFLRRRTNVVLMLSSGKKNESNVTSLLAMD